MIPITIKLDDPRCTPVRAHPSDAGCDLVSKESITIYPGDQHLLDTGLAVKIPKNHVGLVFNRSSQGKLRVQIANGTGVIDSDYRGNIKVLLINNGLDPYVITEFNTRIAQLVIMPILLPEFRVFNPNVTGLWDDTIRGTGGFGSTGV
jgi:dUTP pyrophosphatase